MSTVDPLIAHTAQIVSAYVSKNPLSTADLPALIASTYRALNAAGTAPAEAPTAQEPAVPVRKSIHPEFIICLEDGKKFKSLKRHLRTKFDLSPEQYREKWGLPADYPMAAPNYSTIRSDLAKANGLGRKPLLRAAA